jgi:flagellar hook-length control protein FliK
LRIIIGRICVRASATSRTVSPASLPASQAKSNANQADAASPFALMLASTAPVHPAKPLRKDAQDSSDKSDEGDKPANSTASANQNDSSGSAQGLAQSSSPPRLPAKAEKADKSGDQAVTKPDSNTADGGQNTTMDQQLSGLQAAALAPQAQAVTTASDNDSDDIEVGAVGSAATAASSPSGVQTDAAVPDPAASKPSDAAAAQAPTTQQADDSQSDDVESQLSTSDQALAAQAQAGNKPSTSGDKTVQSGPSVIAANVGQNRAGSTDAAQAGTAASNIAANSSPASNAAQDSTGQNNIGKDADSAIIAAKADWAKNDAVKNDTNKSGAGKIRAAQNSAADSVSGDKADTDSTSDAAEPRTTPNQATLDSVQTAPKSAPPPIQGANASFDISTAAGPQQPGQTIAATPTQQDIQVSAQPAPNLPALAVEIAARSQSGAKQFDIRLDPPELGRVDVRLSIDATGKASAHLSADQPRTLTLLQNDAPTLTRALRDAGLDVSQDGLNFSLRQQAGNNGGNAGDNGHRGTSRAFSLTATTDIDTTALTAAYRGIANGRLDIRV